MQDGNPHPPSKTAAVPEALTPWWRLPFVFWPLLIGTLLALGGIFGARPAWRLVKQHRADGHLAKGEQSLADGKFNQAIDQGRLALQLTPESPRAWRLMAESLTRAGARSGLEYWQRVLNTPEATAADRESFVELALQEGLIALASNQISRLASVPEPSPRSRLLGIRFHLLRNETETALALARDLVRRDASNPTNQLALAGILLARPDAANRDEARAVLWQLSSNTPSHRIDAWEYLVRNNSSVREDRETIAAELAALPSQGIRERILLAEVRMLLDPSQDRSIATAALTGIDPRTDPERLAVALWLQRYRLFDLSLSFLAPNHIRGKPALFRARIDALVGSLRIQTAYRELLESGDTLDPLETELLRLRAAQSLKDEEAVTRHRDQLLRAAGRDPSRVRRVAEFAERNRLPDLAIEAWKRLMEDRYESPRALRALASLADQAGDTWAARDYTRRVAKLDPANPALQLQVAHYDLLLGDDPARALEVIKPLLDNAVVGTDARFVAALALLRSGETEQAWTSLQGTVYSSGPIPTPLRAILAAVVGGVGFSNRAAEIARSLPLAQLRPEERDLLRPYLVMPLLRSRSLDTNSPGLDLTTPPATPAPASPAPTPAP